MTQRERYGVADITFGQKRLARIVELARRQETTVSALVRQLIDLGFELMEQSAPRNERLIGRR